MDISVVVCTYNRFEMLRAALESLACQETDEKFSYEVLVIDNGSTDGTSDVVNDFIRKTPKVPIRYVYEEDRGLSVARNRGIKEVCGKWIAFFDDDQWAEPHWLLELYKVAMKNEADCVGGAVLLDLPDSANLNLSPFCRSSALRELLLGYEPKRCSEKVELGTCNVVIRRKLFERIGTFDANILTGGEDSDFFWRASKQGAKIWYAPKAVVHHIIPESRLREEYFRRTSLRGGLSSARLRYRHKGRLRWFLGLGRRIFRSFARDVWLLLIALLLRNKSRQLDRKCRLWRTIGYVRGSVSLLAPRIFSQKRFFDTLNYRTRGGESAKENRQGDGKI
jgi:GT2 family glycosyltransferase